MIESLGRELLEIDESRKIETIVGGEQALWRIVQRRDPRYYASFVFGVKSTGIFCRPTCASRRAKRSQVVFFPTFREARAAGFRACLRCTPDDESREPRKIRIVKGACKYIEENYEDKITLNSIAERESVSPFYLHRIFKKIIGLTPKEYLESFRLRRLKLSLKKGESITKSTYDAGYNTSSWLYSKPNSKLGMSPSSYKSGAEGMRITFLLSDCSLGRLLVAGTGEGICGVSLGDSDAKLIAFLRAEYPRAVLTELYPGEENGRPDEGLRGWVDAILEYLDRGRDLAQAKLPLDLKVTAFQWKVLKELRKIPFGETRSYSEIAIDIGCPEGSRAVANACASNPVALVIPCHRVVRKTGELGGYRWGLERKGMLLEKERTIISNS